MQRTLAVLGVVAACAFAACTTSRSDVRAPAPSSARVATKRARSIGGGPRQVGADPIARAPEGAPATAVVDGRSVPLRYASARVLHGHLELALSEAPLDCEHPAAPRALRVDVTVPPGPGGGFFAGTTIGAPVHVVDGVTDLHVPPADVRLRLDAFELAKGAHVRGAIHVAPTGEGAGTNVDGDVDVALCSVDPAGVAGPSAIVPDGAVSGHLGETRFRAASVVALVTHDDRTDEDRVASLVFFPRAVDCASWRAEARKSTTLSVFDIARASTKDSALGEAQPVLPVLTDPTPDDATGKGRDRFFGGALPFGQGWIRIDTLRLEPGGVVAGLFVAESDLDAPPEEDGIMGGTFKAMVCR